MTTTIPSNTELLTAALNKYLSPRPDAYAWLMSFRTLCHAIDDVIDLPDRRADNEFIGYVTNLYVDILSADFYSSRRHLFYAIVKSCHHFYFNSVKWEKSEVEWQRTYADVIRCCTNNMVVAVVECVVREESNSYEAGYEAAREIGLLVAEKSWFDHHTKEGLPI